MRKLILAFTLLCFAAPALATEVQTECRFKGDDGKDRLKCRVEWGYGPPGIRDVPICGPIPLKVRCSNGFELQDGYATYINRPGFGAILGLGHKDSALITYKQSPASRDEQYSYRANLTIREDDEAFALEGECRPTNIPSDSNDWDF